MARRAFIILLRTANLLSAPAEQSWKICRIGLLTAGSCSGEPGLQSGVHDDLTDLGWVEGRSSYSRAGARVGTVKDNDPSLVDQLTARHHNVLRARCSERLMLIKTRLPAPLHT